MPRTNDDICDKLSEIQAQLVVLTDILKGLAKTKPEGSNKKTKGVTMIPYPIQSLTPENTPTQTKHKAKASTATKPPRSREVPKILNDLLISRPIGNTPDQTPSSRQKPVEPLSSLSSSALQPTAPTATKRLRLESLSSNKKPGARHLRWS